MPEKQGPAGQEHEFHSSLTELDIAETIERIPDQEQAKAIALNTHTALERFKKACQESEPDWANYRCANYDAKLLPSLTTLYGIKEADIGSLGQHIYGEFTKFGEHMDRRKQALPATEGIVKRIEGQYPWFYVGVNEVERVRRGLRERNIGRIYVNPQPQNVPRVFAEIVNLGAKTQIPFELKARGVMHSGLNEISKKSYERKNGERTILARDRIVVYFDNRDESGMLKIIEELAGLHGKEMSNDRPDFTMPLGIKANGQKVPGFSFGEEPNKREKGRTGSFSSRREEILSLIELGAQKAGRRVYEPSFNIDAAFNQVARREGIDPDNPAFNLGSTNFPEIRKLGFR